MPAQRWATSVNELVQIFRDGLIALIPMADRAQMRWREPDNYDDWDSIAAAIFESIVLRSLEESSEWEKFNAVPQYNRRTDHYSGSSFLTTVDEPGAWAFICFETESSPFDTCLFGRLDEADAVISFERRGADSVTLVLAGRSANTVKIVDTLRVLL